MERVNINLNPPIPPLPKIEDKTKINVRYTLISPYVSVHIYWDKKSSEVLYKIEEPKLNKKETEYKEELISAMKNLINFD